MRCAFGLRCLVLSSSTRHHITTTDFVPFCGKGKNRGKPSCPNQRQRTLAASLPSLKQRCGAPMSNRYNHHLATTVRRAVPFHTIVQEVSGPDNVRSQRRGEKGTFTARDAAIFPLRKIALHARLEPCVSTDLKDRNLCVKSGAQ